MERYSVVERIIPDDPTVGVVIGTYGSVPKYMDLNNLCARYGAEFSTASIRAPQKPHGLGDLAVFWHGLLWAKWRWLDLLVKISRRWLICYNWVPGLVDLAMRAQYPTYTNRCRTYNDGFRPEFIGLHVGSWYCDEILLDMKGRIERADLYLPEQYLHDMALIAHSKNRCSVNDLWEKEHGHQDRGGYGVWDALGEDRRAVPKNVIWHDQHVPEVYLTKAQEYGLPYKLEDFTP